MVKSATKSKTILFNSLGIGLEVILLFLAKDIVPVPPEIQISIIAIVNALMNVLLRFATKEGITLKRIK